MSDSPRENYIAINRANWESRVPIHLTAYDLDRLRGDPAALSNVVAFDRLRLGDISGLEAVHLQCHIGTDTLSLSRLGARMTGLDFSPSALEAARELAASAGHDITFVESDLYSASEALGEGRFDLVYTGVGALCWLPDVAAWARVVASLLRPGGRLFIREGHPVLWSLGDPREDGVITIEYPYFETATGTTFEEPWTYVDSDLALTSPQTVQFNHGIGEVITAVMEAGMTLTSFEEHDTNAWNAFADRAEELDNGEYRLIDRPERLPVTYTLQATKGR